MNPAYTPVIGLEIHIELATKSKMFCGCPAYHFGKTPNSQTCPVCLGLPGALPVPNSKAIDWTALIGLAFHCRINNHSKFDRKNYFYPDLPKGYQISQYDTPIAQDGHFSLNSRTIRIRRVHLEEDTGKLQHATVDGQKVSLIDFNRSGVPLVEIVTEPDISSSAEAKQILQEIQSWLRALGVSDCDMEKGSMRLEANVSVKKSGEQELPRYKVELKNINSFRFLEKAISYDIDRQIQILETGGTPVQETRGYSESKGQTISQRSKEEANDYRYFPEPDIPPIEISEEKIEKLKTLLSETELPNQTKEKLVTQFNLSSEKASTLVASSSRLAAFKSLISEKVDPKLASDIAINTKENQLTEENLIRLVEEKTKSGLSDENQIREVVQKVISENPQAVSDIKSGKSQAVFALIGKIKQIAGSVDIALTQKLLGEEIKKT